MCLMCLSLLKERSRDLREVRVLNACEGMVLSRLS